MEERKPLRRLSALVVINLNGKLRVPGEESGHFAASEEDAGPLIAVGAAIDTTPPAPVQATQVTAPAPTSNTEASAPAPASAPAAATEAGAPAPAPATEASAPASAPATEANTPAPAPAPAAAPTSEKKKK